MTRQRQHQHNAKYLLEPIVQGLKKKKQCYFHSLSQNSLSFWSPLRFFAFVRLLCYSRVQNTGTPE